MFGIYVHWPFCTAKCPYCDFNSHVRAQIDEAAWTDGIVRELAGRDASAKFVCVLALARPHGGVETFRGEIHGRLVFPLRGTRGFGYDPIFVADGMTETFGEIDPALKHSISHRAKAFEKFVAALGLKL